MSFVLSSCSLFENPPLSCFSAVWWAASLSEAIKSATDSACDKSNFPFLKARIVNSPAVAILHPSVMNSCNNLFCIKVEPWHDISTVSSPVYDFPSLKMLTNTSSIILVLSDIVPK